MCMCMHVCMCVCVPVCMCVCLSVVHVCVCACMHVRVCVMHAFVYALRIFFMDKILHFTNILIVIIIISHQTGN